MYDIARLRENMQRAQESVYQRLQMFRSNRRQPHNLHTIMSLVPRSEISAAVNRYVMPHAR